MAPQKATRYDPAGGLNPPTGIVTQEQHGHCPIPHFPLQPVDSRGTFSKSKCLETEKRMTARSKDLIGTELLSTKWHVA